jgi:hypothetical protein
VRCRIFDADADLETGLETQLLSFAKVVELIYWGVRLG